MQLHGHEDLMAYKAAKWLNRLNAIRFTPFKIAVNPFFKILSEFVDGGSFIKNQGFVANSFYLTAKAIVLFAVFHRTLVTFVFQIINNIFLLNFSIIQLYCYYFYI